MARLYPTYQEFMDLRDGTKVGVTRVVIRAASGDFITLPNATQIAGLQVTGTNAADFYLNPNGNTVSIDSATVGDIHIITSLHKGWINYGDET